MEKLTCGEMFDVRYLVKDIIESIDTHCQKDDDGDYVVLIGNEDGGHVRTWVSEELLATLRKFVEG